MNRFPHLVRRLGAAIGIEGVNVRVARAWREAARLGARRKAKP